MSTSTAFTHNVMRKYVENLQEQLAEEHINAIKASGKVAGKLLKPLTHYDKVTAAMDITDPKYDMRKFVSVMDAFLPLDGTPGNKDGLLARLSYKSNSKALVAQSFMLILQIPEVTEKLFGGDADHADKLVKLLDQKRKWYLAEAVAESRAKKKALASTAPVENGVVSDCSDFSSDDGEEEEPVENGVAQAALPVDPQPPNTSSTPELQTVQRDLASAQKQLAEVMRELHTATTEARRAMAEAQAIRQENSMFVHQELNVFKEIVFKLIDAIRPAPVPPVPE